SSKPRASYAANAVPARLRMPNWVWSPDGVTSATADSRSSGDNNVADAKSYKLPLPKARGRAAEFYAFCKNHELRFQRCTECGTWRHIPRDMCAKCGSFNWEWARSSGKGKLFSWTTATQ